MRKNLVILFVIVISNLINLSNVFAQQDTTNLTYNYLFDIFHQNYDNTDSTTLPYIYDCANIADNDTLNINLNLDINSISSDENVRFDRNSAIYFYNDNTYTALILFIRYNNDTVYFEYTVVNDNYNDNIRLFYSDMLNIDIENVLKLNEIFENEIMFSNPNNNNYYNFYWTDTIPVIKKEFNNNVTFKDSLRIDLYSIFNLNLTVNITDGMTTSIDDDIFTSNNSSNDFTIYPNPCTSMIKINGDVNETKLYDMSGKLLISTHEKTINMSEYPNGMYLVNCDGKSKKITVQRNK